VPGCVWRVPGKRVLGAVFRVPRIGWRVQGGARGVARTGLRVLEGAYPLACAGGYWVAGACIKFELRTRNTIDTNINNHRTRWRVPGGACQVACAGWRVLGGACREARAGWRVPGCAFRVVRIGCTFWLVRTRWRAPSPAWRVALTYIKFQIRALTILLTSTFT